jgi:hypothetical protein
VYKSRELWFHTHTHTHTHSLTHTHTLTHSLTHSHHTHTHTHTPHTARAHTHTRARAHIASVPRLFTYSLTHSLTLSPTISLADYPLTRIPTPHQVEHNGRHGPCVQDARQKRRRGHHNLRVYQTAETKSIGWKTRLKRRGNSKEFLFCVNDDSTSVHRSSTCACALARFLAPAASERVSARFQLRTLDHLAPAQTLASGKDGHFVRIYCAVT